MVNTTEEGTAMTEATHLTGHDVLDDQHEKVGTVSDVIYDHEGKPRWAVVDLGKLRPEKWVPVAGLELTDGGDVVVPYDKDHIKSAAKASRDHVLEPQTERDLERHYRLTG